MRIFYGLPLVAVLFASPVLADKFVITPSGHPEVVFPGDDVQTANSKIVDACMLAGWKVRDQNQTQIICEIKIGDFTSALQQALIGNKYSTKPTSYVRISLSQIGNSSRAQAASWFEVPMGFGQVQTVDYEGDDNFNNLEKFLIKAGGKFPEGTRIPGPYIGIQGKVVKSGNSAVFNVESLDPSSPAEVAKIAVQDQIIAISGKRFKSDQEMIRRIMKLPVHKSYTLTVLRNGTQVELQVEWEERPPIGAVAGMDVTDLEDEVVEDAVEPSEPQYATLSAQDELGKWGDLLERGLITQEEFNAKKKQLLDLP